MKQRQEYGRRLEARRAELRVKEQMHHRFGTGRLVVVLALAAAVLGAFKFELWSPWWIAAPSLAFVFVGNRMQKAEEERSPLGRAVSYYERAVSRLEGDWAGKGESGSRFLDENHLYANDLDLFGTGSLFELLSTARTSVGEARLAEWLCRPAPGEVVRARQAAVEELAPRLDLREDLAVLGETARGGLHAEALAGWGDGPVVLAPTAFRLVAWVLSVVGAVAVCAFLTYMISTLGLLPLSEPTRSALRIFFLVTSLGMLGVGLTPKLETL